MCRLPWVVVLKEIVVMQWLSCGRHTVSCVGVKILADEIFINVALAIG